MPISLLNRRIAADEPIQFSSKMLPNMTDESFIGRLPRQKLPPTPDNNDPVFDRFVSLAKSIFEVPMALVTIADDDCSRFKANTGLEGAIETIQEASFCAYSILPESPDVFIVNDGRQDVRFFSNPVITGPPFIRFFAGAALLVDDVKIGAICIIDTKPRPTFSRDNALKLLDLGKALSILIQDRREKALKSSRESAKMMLDMMRSLHRSVLRSNKATHKLLKNIEDRKKSTPSRYSMSTLFTSTVLDSISESPPSSTHTVHTAVAVEAAALHTPFPILLVKTRSQIHPDVIGDQNRVQEKSTVILDENNPFNNKYILPNGIAEFQISNVEHSVQTVERNHSKLENELLKREGEGIREGLEQLPGERQRNGEGRGQYLEQGPGEGQRQGRGQYLEQGPGEGQRQGRGQYLEQGPGEGQRQGLEQGEGLGLGQGFKREIVLEQALGEEWGQGHDQREAKGEGDEKDLGWGEGEERQRQLLNASARAVSSDLVSDLQDEGDHLVSDLQDEGDRLVSDLRDEGDHLVSDLRGEGDHLVSDLRDGGVHLVSDLQDEGGHLVSDLQDEGDHLTVAYESASNIRLTNIDVEESVKMLEPVAPMVPCDVLKTIDRARSALLNIDEPSNVVWTVDQKFLSNGSKHCVQLNILYFSLISMVEIFSEMWHDVRVHIYFQEIDNDDDVNEDLYNAAFNSLQPYNYDSNNDNNNIGYQNKRKNTNEFNYKDHLKYEYESKDENNDGIKHSDENKEKDKTNWLKGRLIIKFGSSGEKVLGEEERSLSQGLASLHTLHRVLIDAGGGCAAQHGAQYKALGSGTPFNGARDKDRDGDGTITGALNSVNFNKRNNDNKNSSKTNKYGGAYDGGMTCWIPCGILLTDSYEEHSPEHQEPSPSKRRDILMDLFVDPSERKHSIHKQKLFILDFDKKNQEKKLKKEKNNTHEEKNQNNDKIRKRSWINIPEFIARLSNTNKNKNDNEINDKNKNKNGNELKEMNVEVTANKWEFRNDQLKELKELKIPKSPSSSPSQSSAGCLSGLNLIYSKDNLNIAGYIRDKKWILNDNCALDRDTLEWPAPHGRMRRGTGSNNESYAILDTGRPYWKSSPIFSHSSSTTPPSSPIPLSPYSEIPLSPYSHSHSHTHIASHSAFSNSPPLSPSLSPSRSSSLISSPRHFASTPFPPPFSPQPSPPKNSPKIQQELYGPQYWPSNVDNVNGKKDSRTSANTEKKKLRASLNALSSAAMLSSLVDEDLKEYNHTTFTFEIKSNRNKNKRPSRRSSFSAVLNRLSNSFRFPTKSPSVSI